VRLRASSSFALLGLLAAVALVATGCGGGDEEATASSPGAAEPVELAAEGLSGRIEADGSSTVGPLVTAAAEAFQEANPDVTVTVGVSGTGGGFERFCAGETDVSNASRPIKADEEAPICAENGVEYTELQVAIDALTVVVNPANDWASCLTIDQLRTIWAPESEGTVTSWSDVDSSFPDEELVLAGAGTDSGTFDYFTDAVNGEEGASRADYTASEDDNVTVQAVAGARGGLGYFGLSYYLENQETLKAVEIDGGGGCVPPSAETAQDGTYAPLARPLFVYVKNESLAKPEVAAFVRYLLDENAAIAESALFIPLNEAQLAESEARLAEAIGG
jgi:phosphate transport system substrate-binding protein